MYWIFDNNSNASKYDILIHPKFLDKILIGWTRSFFRAFTNMYIINLYATHTIQFFLASNIPVRYIPKISFLFALLSSTSRYRNERETFTFSGFVPFIYFIKFCFYFFSLFFGWLKFLVLLIALMMTIVKEIESIYGCACAYNSYILECKLKGKTKETLRYIY